ncbi:unnamed protein product [Rotaria socialis]|uniref:Uncharacterized protein n=1 Tax=Rotaria socialis TaxID=392032 RepID=A0A820THG8_9BILA|nr:unnamed protein product [Rotaria socialis]CAF4472053.1 unnamed protein product [Rotaria socialis]CAF4578254.1 unnamed protein product [Rotaria socialis]CAF4595890.1 unnamed protein product [Rotaria socialis]CAF4743696.1 unnamed protein product [Rotaria socialis]
MTTITNHENKYRLTKRITCARMVKIALQFKANLENVTDFHIESFDDFIWYLKLECTKCHTPSDTYHDINLRQLSSNLNIEPSKPSMNYTSDDADNHTFKTVVIFDCRGIEPIDWQPGDGWACQGVESGTKFSKIDLSENKEWMDYDEKAKEAVTINELEFKFVKVK